MINYLLLGGIAVGLGLLIGKGTHLLPDYRGSGLHHDGVYLGA